MSDRNGYTHRTVEKLLGLTEESEDRLQITILDILNWMRDPGGDNVWAFSAEREGVAQAWRAKRGPLAPDSAAACIVYDFMRGLRTLELKEQGVVALVAFGFSHDEVAKIMGIAKHDVQRVLFGPRDGSGKHGAISKVTAAMNGRKDAARPAATTA